MTELYDEDDNTIASLFHDGLQIWTQTSQHGETAGTRCIFMFLLRKDAIRFLTQLEFPEELNTDHEWNGFQPIPKTLSQLIALEGVLIRYSKEETSSEPWEPWDACEVIGHANMQTRNELTNEERNTLDNNLRKEVPAKHKALIKKRASACPLVVTLPKTCIKSLVTHMIHSSVCDYEVEQSPGATIRTSKLAIFDGATLRIAFHEGMTDISDALGTIDVDDFKRGVALYSAYDPRGFYELLTNDGEYLGIDSIDPIPLLLQYCLWGERRYSC